MTKRTNMQSGHGNRPWWKLIGAALATSLLAACAGGTNLRGDPAEMETLADGYSPRIQSILTDLYREGELNAVLNFSRLGQAAFQEGELELAAKALDEAIARIESVYANTPEARRARSNWSSEGTKDFKGEPYERAMTFYYRGLVDLALGDFDNARASFLAGEFQDTLSEKEEFRGDFAILNWLAGWASHCGDQPSVAQEYFNHANSELRTRSNELWPPALRQSLQPWLRQPGSDHRTLVVTEHGRGPTKAAEGQHKHLLVFRTGVGGNGSYEVIASSTASDWDWDEFTNTFNDRQRHDYLSERNLASALESLYYQASTRGGRQIDGVLEGQAQFKDTARAVGDSATMIGTQVAAQGLLMNDSDLSMAGGAIALIGMFAGGLSAASKPAADTRYWSAMPGWISATNHRAALDEDLTVRYRPRQGAARAVEPDLDRVANGCRLVYLSSPEFHPSSDVAAARRSISENEFNRTIRRNNSRDQQLRGNLLANFSRVTDVPEAQLSDIDAGDELIEQDISMGYVADGASEAN